MGEHYLPCVFAEATMAEQSTVDALRGVAGIADERLDGDLWLQLLVTGDNKSRHPQGHTDDHRVGERRSRWPLAQCDSSDHGAVIAMKHG